MDGVAPDHSWVTAEVLSQEAVLRKSVSSVVPPAAWVATVELAVAVGGASAGDDDRLK